MWETLIKFGLLIFVISKLKGRPMFFVKITKIGKEGGLNEQITKMKTEKFYELIGRFTFKMGAPEEIVTEGSPIRELAFYERIADNYSYVTIEYVKIAKDGEIIHPQHSTKTTTTVAYESTEDKTITDERLVDMTNDGCFKVS